ncbi:dihydrofolate reductase family protein [Cellulomonas xylanilytica]|uniref:Deaminase reductase n=1 Tax=Cellulomonas xylanilytica TaxID=233583 RepID=A0A510V8S1_9CELL|nr:dihydrofolate reductase family protein [Cellulomonas xylanilytica]GEK23243.1 deaminase reductase [Cellulomonas xylanilytica]
MGIVRMSSSVSLDGFSAGPDTSREAPLGVGGERLHRWLFPEREGATPSEADAAVAAAQFARTGAVVVGRRTYDIGVDLWGDTPFPVPTFVVTHRAHEPRPMRSATFTFVTDGIASAVAQAVLAAGGRDVLVMGGADVCRQALAAGVVDEIEVNLVPVLLHRGERLLDVGGDQHTELVRTGLVATDEATHLTFRVVR